MAREFVGCREEKTLQARRARDKISYQCRIARGGQEILAAREVFTLHEVSDVKHGEAFGYGQLADVNTPVGDRVKNFAARNRMIEKVFTGLQRVS